MATSRETKEKTKKELEKIRKKWEPSQPDPRRVKRVIEILWKYGVTDGESVTFIQYILRDLGLFWDPIPSVKTTYRDIKRRAVEALKGVEEDKKSLIEGNILSEIYQTVRGGRVITMGVRTSRRSDPEVTYVCKLIEYHLNPAIICKVG